MSDNMPSIGQMFKLVIILLLALIAVGIVVAIVKMVLPLLILAAIIAGAYYLYTRMQNNKSAS